MKEPAMLMPLLRQALPQSLSLSISHSQAPSPNPFVVVVIVHWGSVDDTLECLASLNQVDYDHLSVIVVDNGAPQFDETRLRAAFNGVILLRAGTNLGFAAGNNLGIRRALSEGADAVLLLNNDTVVSPNLITELLPTLQRPEVGIVGPVITYYQAPQQVWYAGGRYSQFFGYSYKARPLSWDGGERRVDFINGCAMLVKREVFEAVGLLWDDLFLYFEEIEFCLRASQAGKTHSPRAYQSVLVSKPLVRHKVSAGKGDGLQPSKAYYFARNALLLVRRDLSGVNAITGTLSQFLVIFPFWAAHCLLSGNISALQAYVKGLWDGVRGQAGKRVDS